MIFRRRFVASALALTVLAAPANALASDFGLGDGHSGPLVVDAPSIAVNAYAPLAEDASPGATTLMVAASNAFAAGDLVLVWQTAGFAPSASGDDSVIDLSNADVGRWELARIGAVVGSALVLTAPVSGRFAAAGSQIVRIPEYTTVTIASGASIREGHPWDGASGGVVALFASGAVTVDGTIAADGAGFRGGVFTNEAVYDHEYCTALDDPTPGNGGGKGEGIAGASYGPTFTSRGNIANGGGGGDCKNSGGAGGGNGGAGGAGGRSYNDDHRLVGGIGGAPLVYSLRDHATFGGGGGSGHGNDQDATDGGRGGGFVLVRAASLSGHGVITADGAMGAARNQYGKVAGEDGQGGGGAGGSIFLHVDDSSTCGIVRARGANGTDDPATLHGPGGGGGGGHVLFLPAPSPECAIDVSAGISGIQPDPNGQDGPHFAALPLDASDPANIGTVEGVSVPRHIPMLYPGGCSAEGGPVHSTWMALLAFLLLPLARKRHSAPG